MRSDEPLQRPMRQRGSSCSAHTRAATPTKVNRGLSENDLSVNTAPLTLPPAIQQALDCLSGALPLGARVIVFGSHSEGRAQADSDIDLFVIEPEVANRTAETIRLSELLGRRLIPADVVVMSSEMFVRQSEIPNTLAWRVAKQGVEYALVP